jgi:hypothetical protein
MEKQKPTAAPVNAKLQRAPRKSQDSPLGKIEDRAETQQPADQIYPAWLELHGRISSRKPSQAHLGLAWRRRPKWS